MADYVLPAVSIALTGLSFFMQLWWRIGAKKKRVSAANEDLVRILSRRIGLEADVPTQDDISRLIEGKTRDHKVRTTDILSATQLLNAVYTRVMESELIQADDRDAILSRIAPALVRSETRSVREQDVAEIALSGEDRQSRLLRHLGVAIPMSILAGLVTIVPNIPTMEWSTSLSEFLPMIVTTATVSLALIGTLYAVLQSRGAEEEPESKAEEVTRYVQFEHKVYEVLVDLGGVRGPRSDAFDFLLEHRGRRFAVEVKAWSTRVPLSMVSLVAARLSGAAKGIGAEPIIVTSKSVRGLQNVGRAEGVMILTLKEFRQYLAHMSH